jgi:hypothetical protein
LKGRRVRFTVTAKRHVDQERIWWLENRDYRDLFATELEAATQVLAVLPGAGTPYAHAHVSGVRRLYLQHLGCHLSYTFDDNQVIVRALWGARRGRGPRLRSIGADAGAVALRLGRRSQVRVLQGAPLS